MILWSCYYYYSYYIILLLYLFLLGFFGHVLEKDEDQVYFEVPSDSSGNIKIVIIVRCVSHVTYCFLLFTFTYYFLCFFYFMLE
jgi:hypothetical protein